MATITAADAIERITEVAQDWDFANLGSHDAMVRIRDILLQHSGEASGEEGR